MQSNGSQNPPGVNDTFHSLQGMLNSPLGSLASYAAAKLGLLGPMTQDGSNVPVSDGFSQTPAQIQATQDGLSNYGGYGTQNGSSNSGMNSAPSGSDNGNGGHYSESRSGE